MKNVAAAQAKAEELSAKGVIGAKELAESYYVARSNNMSHLDSIVAMNAANNLTIATTRDAADAQAQLSSTTRTLTTLQKLSGVGTNQWPISCGAADEVCRAGHKRGHRRSELCDAGIATGGYTGHERGACDALDGRDARRDGRHGLSRDDREADDRRQADAVHPKDESGRL